MTLVACFSVGGLPALVGDLLLSRLLPSKAELPTLAEPSRVPGLDRHFASALGQKLVIVRPWFAIAWAGSLSNATRILRGIDALLPNDPDDRSQDEPVFRLLDSCEEGSELLALVIRGDGIYPLAVRTAGFVLGGQRMYLLGSGSHRFFKYLDSNPAVVPGKPEKGGFHAQALALRFGARAVATQWITGSGLEESWGGGFELVYPDRDRVFRKADKVLFRGWVVDEKGDYSNTGRSFFMRYHGSDLHLSCFNPDETTYVIPSLLGEGADPPTYEACSPTWTVDTVFHAPTFSLVEAARFNLHEGLTKDILELEHGRVSGWQMDRDYVETLMQAAGDIAGSNRAYFSGWPEGTPPDED